MSRKKLLLVFTILLVVFTGCNKPENAVENVFDALKKGDLAKLSMNSTLKTTKYFSMNALRQCNLDRTKYKDNEMALVDKCLKKVYSGVDTKIINIALVKKGEVDVDVEIRLNENIICHKWKVVKLQGDWRVYFEGKKN